MTKKTENCALMESRATEEVGVSVGLGTTANCNFNCGHCYSRPLRGESLTLAQMMKIIKDKNIKSINFGTGENILNPDFPEIIDRCYEKGIKLSLTSNGYSIMVLSDEQLKKFNDLDISLDFASQTEQNDFRHGESWNFVDEAIKKCRRLGIEFSITTAIMNINYKEIPLLLSKAAKEDCNLRVNIFKPVPQAGIYQYLLTFEEFWEAMRLLFENGNLISCSEPIVNAMLNIPPVVPKSPCGTNSLRIHPNGEIVPCVYWTESDVHLNDIEKSFIPAFESESFKKIGVIPEFCKSCEKVEVCGGGCASRRYLNKGLDKPDDYCPVYYEKEIPKITVTKTEKQKDLVHSSYLCTLIFEGKK